MKSYRKELWFETPGRRAFLNITPQVEAALKESAVQEGLALVNAMHITASVFINDDERGLQADYDAWLERLAPHAPVSGYRHNETGEDNADAHMKRQIMGGKSWSRLRRANSTSVPGSRFFTASLTAAGGSAR
jgi:secondary thiamine-phosphate synthase enzyme